MKRGIISDEGSYLRCLLLLPILSFSTVDITTNAFQIVRPSTGSGVGQDRYDRGVFVYNNQIVDVDCATSKECQCYWGGTFVFKISNDGNLQPTCIYSFSDVFGCNFHIRYKYNVLAVNSPNRIGSSVGIVRYNNLPLNSISSIGEVSFWNMTWHTASLPIFRYRGRALIWNSSGDDYKGLLLKINMTASRESSSLSGCMLLKIAGTRSYPLTPYRSQVTSYKVTPTTSMASTQMQSQIIHVSSTVTVIQSLAATSSSSSLFDHRTMSASSEHFKIGSLTPSIPRVVHSLSTFDVSIKSVSSASHRSHTPPISIKSALSSTMLSSVIQDGKARDTSKQSGDNVPVIVGASLGSLFGIVAILMVTLLCRRHFFGKENITKQDKLQLQFSGDSYKSGGTHSGGTLQKMDNPMYGETMELSMHSSDENRPSTNVYESPIDGISNKNQAPDQVYSEIDERQEPLYNEVENDEPIYKEVIEERPISQGFHVPNDPSSPQSPVYQVIDPVI